MKRSLALFSLLGWILFSTLAWAQGMPTASREDVAPSSAKLGKVMAAANAFGQLNWVTGSAGDYRWGGAAGTAFWVDYSRYR